MSETTPTPERAEATVKSKEEFDQLLQNAKGPVLIDFIQPDCGHCVDETPAFERLRNDCKDGDAVIARVNVKDGFGAELAEKLKVDGTPTSLFAKTPQDFLDGRVQEIADLDSSKARRAMKCALPVKK